MQLPRLAKAITTGLFQQIPIVGPVLQNILAEKNQATLEHQIAELVSQFKENKRLPAKVESEYPTLVPALLQAEAEVKHRLKPKANPKRRFLYLASSKYASAVRTYDIAMKHAFLWRNYNNSKGAKIANVGEIEAGDMIVLGYRSNGSFRLLLPLVVQKRGPNTVKIDKLKFSARDYTPFAWADDALAPILNAEGYGPDPLFKRHTGLNVRPLFAEVSTVQAITALKENYPSPGNNAIWRHDSPRLPAAVRDWISAL